MVRALAIETSGRQGSVALVDGGDVVVERAFAANFQHAAGVIAVIDEVTRERGWRAAEVAEVYVSAGPGSFTGLRVGVTVAKTLAFAVGCKLVAVPTTEVLAWNAPAAARRSVVLLDAKRGQVFSARYAYEGGEVVEEEPPRLDELAAVLGRCPRPLYLIGEGIAYHRGAIPAEEGVVVTAEEAWRARAGVVARIGWRMAREGRFVEAERLTPTYIRRPEAEEKWEAMGRG